VPIFAICHDLTSKKNDKYKQNKLLRYYIEMIYYNICDNYNMLYSMSRLKNMEG